MDASFGDYLDWLRQFGIPFSASGVARDPDHDASLIADASPTRVFSFPGLPDVVEHRDPAAGLAADHASESVVRALVDLVRPGDSVWDIGCGTGLLTVAPALLGARPVIGTELDPAMLALARRTVAAAGVDAELFECSLLDAVPAGARADLVIANLPHKPVPRSVGLKQAGGRDGSAVHTAFVDQAEQRLHAGARVVFFLHSLPHRQLLKRYADVFDLTLLRWKRRYLQPGEYGELQDRFVQRARDGKSFVAEEGDRRFLVACVWHGVKR